MNWKELELEYAKCLRAANKNERKKLYNEAYDAVSKLAMLEKDLEPEKRTAGTNETLVKQIARLCKHGDKVLEIGCGRGFTCWKLSPYVSSILGIDVSTPSLKEAKELIKKKNIRNVEFALMPESLSILGDNAFDKIITIDVFEHLHPDDGKEHLNNVFNLLKPRGAYIIVTPNRLVGPSDITWDLFPGETEAKGFHLNEVTYKELITQMQCIGYTDFRSTLFPPHPSKYTNQFNKYVSAKWKVCIENIFCLLKKNGIKITKKVLNIFGISPVVLVAHKPVVFTK